MYHIFLINFGYYLDQTFDNLDAAIAFGKSKGFEFSVYKSGLLIGSATGVSFSWKEG